MEIPLTREQDYCRQLVIQGHNLFLTGQAGITCIKDVMIKMLIFITITGLCKLIYNL